MTSPIQYLGGLGGSNDPLAEIRRYSLHRIGEVWLYAIGLVVVLGLLGWVLAGTWRMVLPIGAIFAAGGVVGTLLVLFYRHQALKRVEDFLLGAQRDSRSLEQIATEMRNSSSIDPEPIITLSRPIFFQ